MTVLLIDDDAIFREFLRTEVADRDATLIFVDADDGDTGLRLFKESSCDAIVVDMNMPRMSGLSFVSTVRDSDRSVPIVLISNLAIGLRQFSPKILAAGVDAVLDKGGIDFVPKLINLITALSQGRVPLNL